MHYSFMASNIDTDEENDIVSIRELHVASLPDEIDDDQDDDHIVEDKEGYSKYDDRSLGVYTSKNEKILERRVAQNTSDDGSVIDLVCLYTRQALEPICEGGFVKKIHEL